MSHVTPPWTSPDVDESLVDRLVAEAHLSRIVARILISRGITGPDEVERFLRPDVAFQWLDADEVPGMPEVADSVAAAVRDRKRVLVFGDFDVDGLSAAAVACRGLRVLGATVEATVPHRFREGYGLTDESVARVLEMRPDLVVTVDCGVSCRREVDTLRRHGIEVVVTDHHEPGELVPVGVPVSDPKLGEYRGGELAGAGVALKLVQAVGRRLGRPDVWRELTDLATLGTVADVVPLLGENRALVADGLARARGCARPSLAALATVAGVDLGSLSSTDLAYQLVPRLNAAGRVGDPDLALRLLLTDDPAEAAALAADLDTHNKLRQAAEQDLLDAASAMAERELAEGDRVLVLAGEGWHEGVKGIVAGRLARRYHVPTLLFCLADGLAQGSGRSVGSIDLYDALSSLGDMLDRYGGHQAAVGLTLSADRLPELKRELAERFAQLPAELFEVPVAVDGELELEQLSEELAAELALLEPFGFANPRPLIGTGGVFMNGRKRVGKDESHLKFDAYDGVVSLPAIAFRCRDIESLAGREAAVDVTYELEVDEWRGRRRLQLLVRDLFPHPDHAASPAAELVDDLFARAEEILSREDYSGIGEAEAFHTKLAGVTFEGRQEAVARLMPGAPLRLERQPDNPHDPNACAVFSPDGGQVGFFNKRLAAALAPLLDEGLELDVEVTEVTGGVDGRSLGVNVLVSHRLSDTDAADAAESAAERRAALAALDPSALDEALREHFLGERSLHDAQRDTLARLAGGKSCLTVMATGRGKSLIFHLHAARIALAAGRASVFVYPLRALVADQAFHLTEAFADLGLRVAVLTGESGARERDDLFSAMGAGELDAVMTTPEFLEHHAGRFAESGRIGFVVVDEAHHVGMARAGHRPSYARLGEALETLGRPTVLAVTATAGDEVAATIREVLGVSEVVCDPTVRDNLVVVDRRSGGDKVAYLSSLAARGGKLIVYVNSRDQSVTVAKQLREKVPGLVDRVAFYNGGLSRPMRHSVERAFREGDLSVVVATSAFGEGVNIPDVRNVALFHLPFNEVEFNQMCGRAGRDGAEARVHLLYSTRDARLNDLILESLAPARDDLAQLYLVLGELQKSAGDEMFDVTNAELAEAVKRRRKGSKLTDKSVSTALGIFRELGFVESEGAGGYRHLRLRPRPEGKIELTTSVRYAEGMEEQETFEAFKRWSLDSPSEELLRAFDRPILPGSMHAEAV